MKTFFIEAKSKRNIDKSKIEEISRRLPGNIAISYSIQFKDSAREIKEILSEKGKHKITTFIQVLGCSKPNFPKDTEAILLVSSGKFHAISLAFETKIPVYIFDNYKLEKVSEEEVGKLDKKQKGVYMRFLNSDNVGILISTKPGQENLKESIDFKNSLNVKKAYLFINNSINLNEFENFPSIESWINTACPRMDMNKGDLINLADLKAMLKNKS